MLTQLLYPFADHALLPGFIEPVFELRESPARRLQFQLGLPPMGAEPLLPLEVAQHMKRPFEALAVLDLGPMVIQLSLGKVMLVFGLFELALRALEGDAADHCSRHLVKLVLGNFLVAEKVLSPWQHLFEPSRPFLFSLRRFGFEFWELALQFLAELTDRNLRPVTLARGQLRMRLEHFGHALEFALGFEPALVRCAFAVESEAAAVGVIEGEILEPHPAEPFLERGKILEVISSDE